MKGGDFLLYKVRNYVAQYDKKVQLRHAIDVALTKEKYRQANKKLLERLEYLEAENAYLKKSYALIQKREQRSKKE